MDQPTPIEHQVEPAVSFPEPRPIRPSTSGNGGGFPKWIFAVVGLVIILAVGGFFLYQSSTSSSVNPTPSPFVSGLSDLPTPTEAPLETQSPSPSPSATPSTAQKSEISVEVQNGTGTSGDAALAKSLIEKAGYTKVTTGNASSQTAVSTTLQYSSDVSASVASEIAKSLASSFGTVTPSVSSTLKAKSVIVITGPKAAMASPATKATATPTASPKPSPTATP